MSDSDKIEVNCIKCGKKLAVPWNTQGKITKCPDCGGVIRIPVFKPCPKCGKKQPDSEIFCECGALIDSEKKEPAPLKIEDVSVEPKKKIEAIQVQSVPLSRSASIEPKKEIEPSDISDLGSDKEVLAVFIGILVSVLVGGSLTCGSMLIGCIMGAELRFLGGEFICELLFILSILIGITGGVFAGIKTGSAIVRYFNKNSKKRPPHE